MVLAKSYAECAKVFYLSEVSIIFGKESFINAKKVLDFIESLKNDKKLINPPNGAP